MIDWRDHPDYQDGFVACLDGLALPDGASEPFKAGWEVMSAGRGLLRRAGFHERRPGQFSLTLELRGRDVGG